MLLLPICGDINIFIDFILKQACYILSSPIFCINVVFMVPNIFSKTLTLFRCWHNVLISIIHYFYLYLIFLFSCLRVFLFFPFLFFLRSLSLPLSVSGLSPAFSLFLVLFLSLLNIYIVSACTSITKRLLISITYK